MLCVIAITLQIGLINIRVETGDRIRSSVRLARASIFINDNDNNDTSVICLANIVLTIGKHDLRERRSNQFARLTIPRIIARFAVK